MGSTQAHGSLVQLVVRILLFYCTHTYICNIYWPRSSICVPSPTWLYYSCRTETISFTNLIPRPSPERFHVVQYMYLAQTAVLKKQSYFVIEPGIRRPSWQMITIPSRLSTSLHLQQKTSTLQPEVIKERFRLQVNNRAPQLVSVISK